MIIVSLCSLQKNNISRQQGQNLNHNMEYQNTQSVFSHRKDGLLINKCVSNIQKNIKSNPIQTLIFSDSYSQFFIKKQSSYILDPLLIQQQQYFQQQGNFRIYVNQYKFLNTRFIIFNNLILNYRVNQIIFQSILLKNGNPFKINSSNFKLLLSRYINKLNSKIIGGKFKVEHNTGILSLDVNLILTNRKFKNLMKNQKQLQQYVYQQIKISQKILIDCLYDILYLIQQVENEEINSRNSIYINRNLQNFKNLINNIAKCIQISKYEYEFMMTSRKILNSVNNYQKIIDSRQKFQANVIINNQSKNNLNQKTLSAFINNYQLLDIQSSYQQQWLKNLEAYYTKYLIQPIAKVNKNYDHTFLYSEIFILNNFQDIQFEIVNIGTEATIEKAQIDYVYFDTKSKKQDDIFKQHEYVKNFKLSQKLTKCLVFKSYNFEPQAVQHQKIILNTDIRRKSCVYITKCYYSNQKQFRKFLIMDYYVHKSLREFKTNNKISMSLITKIYLLYQIIQGLRFIRQNDITHLDLKAENVLVGKGLITRLSDFGEAHHPCLNETRYHPRITFPYAAPQIFNQIIDFSQKTDVFSFGILMNQFLYSWLYISVPKNCNQKLKQFQKNRDPKINIIINPQKSKYDGPTQLIQLLTHLNLKCINSNKHERPFLDWILIILRQSLNYLDKLY